MTLFANRTWSTCCLGLWAFLFYFLGEKFELFSDYKALLQICSRKSKPSTWIKRWVLRLQQFDFEIKYKKGTTNQADALSRLSIRSQIEKSPSVTNECVNFIIGTRSKSRDIEKIRHETQMDNTWNLVIKAFKDNSWQKNSQTLHPFS